MLSWGKLRSLDCDRWQRIVPSRSDAQGRTVRPPRMDAEARLSRQLWSRRRAYY